MRWISRTFVWADLSLKKSADKDSESPDSSVLSLFGRTDRQRTEFFSRNPDSGQNKDRQSPDTILRRIRTKMPTYRLGCIIQFAFHYFPSKMNHWKPTFRSWTKKLCLKLFFINTLFNAIKDSIHDGICFQPPSVDFMINWLIYFIILTISFQKMINSTAVENPTTR